MLPSEYLSQHPNALQSVGGLYAVGSLALQSRQWGLARACFEKARTLSPWDRSIQEHLKLARSELTLQLGAAPINPFESLGSAVSDTVAEPLSQVFLAVAIALCTATAWRDWPGRTVSKPSRPSLLLSEWMRRPGGWAFVVSLILAGASLYSWIDHLRSKPAYLLQRTILRSGPAETYMELSTQETGVQVRLLRLSADGAWAQVRYLPDAVAWVPKAAVLF